ncbi:MAG: type II secretion system F family protein [Candidatus Nanoarchaeia archaeon]
MVKKTEEFFKPLASDLRKAHITVPVEQWAALTFFIALLSFVVSYPIAVVFLLLLGFGAISFVGSLPFALVVAVGAFFLTYFYPKLVADNRKKKLENALPFGTLYLSTLARSGFPPQNMFRLLSKFKEYGELSREVSKISNDIEALGLDTPTALTRAINRSPSAAWTEFLAGLRTTITVGGDLAKYLDEKANGFVSEYERKLQEFSNFLTTLVEIYITLVIVGAIFFIVVTSIMSSIGAVPVSMLKVINLLIVGVGLPILTAAFILIAKGASPLED